MNLVYWLNQSQLYYVDRPWIRRNDASVSRTLILCARLSHVEQVYSTTMGHGHFVKSASLASNLHTFALYATFVTRNEFISGQVPSSMVLAVCCWPQMRPISVLQRCATKVVGQMLVLC